MVLSAEGVRKRFLFPSEVWDVRLTPPPKKKCPNSIPCQALMCVFALKGASGAENFIGSPEGNPSGRWSCPRLLLNRKKSSKNWEKWEKIALVLLKLKTIENKT